MAEIGKLTRVRSASARARWTPARPGKRRFSAYRGARDGPWGLAQLRFLMVRIVRLFFERPCSVRFTATGLLAP